MKRIHSLLLIAFLLIPLMFSGNQAYASHDSEMVAIAENARAAVDTALGHLQTALASGTSSAEEIDLLLQTLNLAIANYATASDSLEKARSGDTAASATMLACSAITDGVGNICSLIMADSLAEAQSAYDTASTSYDTLPPPSGPAAIPPGLSEIENEINTAIADASSYQAPGPTFGGGGNNDTGTTDNVGTTNAASPI